MFCVSISYPKKDGSTFDFGYYAKKHIPMVVGYLGANAVRTEIRKGVAAVDGSAAPCVCLANIWIKSVDDLKSTLSKHGPEILGDVPNYTNIQPVIQVDEVVG